MMIIWIDSEYLNEYLHENVIDVSNAILVIANGCELEHK